MTERQTNLARPTVFFDGSCPLCSREIQHYRQLPGSDSIHWVDASCEPTALSEAGLSVATAMRRLHARDASGDWHVGLDAFLLIWRRLPRYGWVAWLLGNRLARPLFSRLYNVFADWRYRRRCKQGCAVGEGD